MDYSLISGAKKREQRDEVGYNFCEHCKTTVENPHCHHLVFRSERPKHEFLHHLDNLILLCPRCHQKFHLDKKIRNPYLEERNLADVFGEDIMLYHKF